MMQKIIVFLFLSLTASYAQIIGCTDGLANNFYPNATKNNGNCKYATAKVKTVFSKNISDSIKETSGLIAFDDLFWTHNDDEDTILYGLNKNGEIKKKIQLQRVKNNDWEAISQDSLYIYIGDFGNNASGNRKDLQILRIDKKSFLSNEPLIDTIAFSYANQTDFTPQKANTTNFDCEAFVVLQDSIYLFTKEWTNQKTTIYLLPKIPGNYVTEPKITLNTSGLISDATVLPKKKGIALCGYSKMLKPFVYLLYDFKNHDFSTGNQRKIKIKLPFHQIEGIAADDEKIVYLTNEATVKKPFINTTQQIHSIDLSPYLKEGKN